MSDLFCSSPTVKTPHPNPCLNNNHTLLYMSNRGPVCETPQEEHTVEAHAVSIHSWVAKSLLCPKNFTQFVLLILYGNAFCLYHKLSPLHRRGNQSLEMVYDWSRVPQPMDVKVRTPLQVCETMVCIPNYTQKHFAVIKHGYPSYSGSPSDPQGRVGTLSAHLATEVPEAK